nr:TRAP transporter small permease [Oceanococcus sp. HetDA_MAG_MS8]
MKPAKPWWQHLEDGVLGALLLALLSLGLAKIGMRWAGAGGANWIDPLARMILLWLALFGALSTVGGDRHLNIRLLPDALPAAAARALKALLRATSMGFCAFLAWVSWRFVRDEWEYGGDWIGGLPLAAPLAVMPVVFALMAARYAALLTQSWADEESRETPL